MKAILGPVILIKLGGVSCCGQDLCNGGFRTVGLCVASLLDLSELPCRRVLLVCDMTLLLCWVLVSMEIIITSLSLS